MNKMSKLRVIWVDDERDPKNFGRFKWWYNYVPEEFRLLVREVHSGEEIEIVWLKSYNEWLLWCLKNWNKENEKEYVNCYCLDHDLASYDACGNEKTGVNVANDICEYCIENKYKLPYYECHSSNPAGKQNIISVFESYRKIYG